jgi:sugar O-acyltransferase (sialic acid O-acetyltransferase NeuD family)
MKRLIIVGAGVFGKQALEIALVQQKYSVLGFYDDFNTDNSFEEFPIFGKIDQIQEDFLNDKFDVVFYGIGYNHMSFKQSLIHKFHDIPMATIVHPSVIIENSAKIEEGVLIYPKSYIGPRVHLQKGVVVNVYSYLPHDNIVGEASFLSGGLNIGGKVNIGERSFIGIGCTTSDSLSICNDVFLGAGSLVLKSIDEPGTYVGSPVKKIK